MENGPSSGDMAMNYKGREQDQHDISIKECFFYVALSLAIVQGIKSKVVEVFSTETSNLEHIAEKHNQEEILSK